MAEPSPKAPEIEHMLEKIFGRTTAIKNNICVACRGEAKEFRDEKSKKEYTISGLCQDCQDEVFGPSISAIMHNDEDVFFDPTAGVKHG